MRSSRRVLGTAALLAVVVGVGLAGGARAEAGPEGHSVARIWNEQLLNAIRKDRPKPPVHARNLFHLSVAMWDAWATYDPEVTGYLYTAKSPVPPLSGSGGDDEQGDDESGDDEQGDDEQGDDESDDETPDGVADGAAIEAARAEAISFAAYRLLRHRFPGIGVVDDGEGNVNPCQPGAAISLAAFDAQMDALGYDRTFTSTAGDSPAAVGNRIAEAVIAHGQTDGANEGADLCYPDDSGYIALNEPMAFDLPGTLMADPNHWQPLAFEYLVLQNGVILGAALQAFVGVGWGDVPPFGLTPADIGGSSPSDCTPHVSAQGAPYLDPGCPPQLGGVGDPIVKEAMLEVLRFQSQMDTNDGVLIDISPGAVGNNPLGSDAGTGHPLNPVTGLAYPPNTVHRADALRVIAEFWADGPKSETPPGHWNTLANYVTDHPQFGDKRIGGAGPIVNDLEWDVKLYLTLNGALHDAAIGAWCVKHFYDSSRPLSLIRHMCGLGQSSDPSEVSYHPDGILLEPGVTEIITEESVLPGGKFEHLKSFCTGGSPGMNIGAPCDEDLDCIVEGVCQSSVGMIAVRSWNGSPPNPATEIGGVGWRRCIDWMPFQAGTFVTPPFPGYTSGHSTYSRAGAEALAAFTGDPYFPGGLGSFTAPKNEYLTFEDGPSETVQLQWATYYDAADQAAISRRMGSIHPWYDDYPARVMGSEIGQRAFLRAMQIFAPSGAGGPGGGGTASENETEGPNGGNSSVEPSSGPARGAASRSRLPVLRGER